MTRQLNTRLPEFSHAQLEQITAEFDLTKVQVLILALDRLTRDLYGSAIRASARVELEALRDPDHDAS